MRASARPTLRLDHGRRLTVEAVVVVERLEVTCDRGTDDEHGG